MTNNRLWLFLYGTPHIAGSLLGLAGLGLLAAGVIGRGWLAITVGLYALGWVAAWTLLPDRSASLAERIRRDDLAEELEDLLARTDKRLPPSATAALQRIRELLLTLLERLRQGNPLFVEQAHHVEQAVRDYLPTTLESFLRLPPVYARIHVIKDGRTAEGLLADQLAVLEDGLKQLIESAAADDAEALLANGRFLDAKFRVGFHLA